MAIPVLGQPDRLREQLGAAGAPQLVDPRAKPCGAWWHADEPRERQLGHLPGADHRIGGIAGEQPAMHLLEQRLSPRRVVGSRHGPGFYRSRTDITRGMLGIGRPPPRRPVAATSGDRVGAPDGLPVPAALDSKDG